MMGPKTLREIREELWRAFGEDGGDPIQRIDQLIAEAKGRGEEVEVLHMLRRTLERTAEEKRRTRPGDTEE